MITSESEQRLWLYRNSNDFDLVVHRAEDWRITAGIPVRRGWMDFGLQTSSPRRARGHS